MGEGLTVTVTLMYLAHGRYRGSRAEWRYHPRASARSRSLTRAGTTDEETVLPTAERKNERAFSPLLLVRLALAHAGSWRGATRARGGASVLAVAPRTRWSAIYVEDAQLLRVGSAQLSATRMALEKKIR